MSTCALGSVVFLLGYEGSSLKDTRLLSVHTPTYG